MIISELKVGEKFTVPDDKEVDGCVFKRVRDPSNLMIDILCKCIEGKEKGQELFFYFDTKVQRV
jgi:hypothetical protein